MDKTKLIIQTPLMYIPNSMIYFNDKPFLELSFNNETNDNWERLKPITSSWARSL